MFEKAKKHIDKRDRKHLISDFVIYFVSLVWPILLMYPDEVKEILHHFGVLPAIATIICAIGGVMLRKFLSRKVEYVDEKIEDKGS